ncbi:hypothetical protein N9850_00535 [Granulosicoccus sp.]|nr:hypothetical protein [Granulosicoccus sp.]MDB4222229.1 hypothetical protein [Granulosicoccus sp.]
MRPNFIKTSMAFFLCAPFAASGSLAADWNGSYSANGQCFCVGAVAPTVENSIVPTPVGGQTVAQVCKRVGAGPSLQLEGDLFNYPVYPDSQCGHGPFDVGGTVTDPNCAGSLDGKLTGSATCQSIGPRWDVKQAFSKQNVSKKQKSDEQGFDAKELVKKQAKSSLKSKPSENLINKPVVTSISVNRADGVQGESRTLKATVISSASTAGRELPKREPMAPFTGRVITIEGKRYMQARKGLPAKGGKPGSRIVLDGLVFLLDDGSINATDLHRTQPAKGKKSQKKTSLRPKKLATKRVANTTQQNTANSKKAKLVSKLQVEPSRTRQTAKADRNSVPRALPAPRKTTPMVAITNSDALDRASERSQVLKSTGSSKRLDTAMIQKIDDSKIIAEPTASQISIVTEELKNTESSTSAGQVGLLSALKLPSSIPKETDRFSYLEAMPVSFDVGGAGLMLEGSTESHSKFHYVGRIGVTNTYQEAMLGAGYHLTPSAADRFTLMLQAGVEYGAFSLDDGQNPAITAKYSDSGLYFGAATRLVLNRRFELKGGLGYSTFFQGDLSMFGGAYWHMTPQLDLVSQFELGDNDLVGLGIRFYY